MINNYGQRMRKLSEQLLAKKHSYWEQQKLADFKKIKNAEDVKYYGTDAQLWMY
ncbi:MAG: hypothetical protein Pg6C_19240 [Treponemataceae bacterium]|nr:MAG: hypothetical protein Pg6C_19240 [Treponemataceae bacterium]